MEKHTCKLCNRSFSNGRAFGGHMKSHIHPPTRRLRLTESPPESTISSTSFSYTSEVDADTTNRESLSYGLRENPKRSVRLVDPHFIEQEIDYESSKSLTRPRSTRSRRRLVPSESDSLASSVSDTSDEDLAFCLIMLSRDQWRKPKYDEKDEEEDSRRFEKKITRSKKRSLTGAIHQCPVCYRVFATGQALGGHKRAHFNAINNNDDKKNDEDSGKSCTSTTLIDLNFPPPDQNQQEEDYLS